MAATLKFRQGAAYACVFELPDDDLTGLEARFQAAAERGAGAPVLDFATNDAGVELELDRTARSITLALGAVRTKALPSDVFEFDLELFDPLDPDAVEPIADGVVVVLPEVKP